LINTLRLYRIHSDWPDSEQTLADLLEQAAFKACPAFAAQSMGFEAPVEEGPQALVRRVAGADLMRLRVQSRVLPAAAVKEALVDRVGAFKQRTRRDPSRRERRELKEEVYDELLPKALLKSDRVPAFYLRDEQVLAVGGASANVAEGWLSRLRDALGSVQAVPLAFKQPGHTLLSAVFLGQGAPQLSLGRECRMRDPSDARSTINWLDMDLGHASVRAHVKAGMSIERLGMVLNGIASFTLDAETVVRKLRLDGMDEVKELADEDPLANQDAAFTVTVGAVNALLAVLKRQLGGYAG